MDATSDIRYSELKEKTYADESRSTIENPLTNFKSTVINLANNASKSNYQKNNFKNNYKNDIKVDIVNDLELTGNPLDKNIQNCDNDLEKKVDSHEADIGFAQLKKQGRFQKKMTYSVVALALLNFILVLIFIKMFMNNHEIKKDLEKYEKNCMTDDCLVVAGKIYTSLDKSIDPCDNFYEYACGGWLKKTLIPAGFPRWGTLVSITYKNQLIIKNSLESNSIDNNITAAELKAKRFFQSCMDPQKIIEKLGSKPLMNVLNKLMYKNEESELVINKTFPELLTFIQIKFGLNSLFDFEIIDDEKNSTFNNIEIMQGTLGLEKSYYLNQTSEKNQKAMTIYKKTIVNVIELLFGKVNNSTEIMTDIVEIETRLAKIMYNSDEISNVEKVYRRVSLKDLNEKHAPFIDWLDFINTIFMAFNSKEVLNENDVVIILGIDYFKNLTTIIEEYRSTPRKEKALKFFTIFYLIRFSLPLLSTEFRNQFGELGTALTGSQQSERWQVCVEQTDSIFGLGYAVARIFMRNMPNNSKAAAKSLIKTIKHSFIENFDKISWMNKQTRILAEDKVNHVDDLIGYPDFIQNDTALNKVFQRLEINEDEYFENEVNLIKHALMKEILNYRTPVDRKEWEMTPSAVNAYYSPTRNQIVFPNGILQEPFFHPRRPMYLNYGSMGSVMGHELAHGFDNSGREYDKNGLLNQWWDQQTIDDFTKASECMVDQYSKFNISGESINGKLTLGENIADNGGLRAAYNAYIEWTRKNGEEKPLPLVNLNQKQLFFVSFAQTWCTKTTPNSAHLSIAIDQHSPPRFRVIGSLTNSVEFANAFKCSKNSKMNPVKKCQLW